MFLFGNGTIGEKTKASIYLLTPSDENTVNDSSAFSCHIEVAWFNYSVVFRNLVNNMTLLD